MNVIWKWIPHTTITIDRPTFNTSIKLFFIIVKRTQSSLNTFFVISYLSSAGQMIIILKKKVTHFVPYMVIQELLIILHWFWIWCINPIGELFISWLLYAHEYTWKDASTVPHLRLLRFEYQKIKLPFSYQIYICQGNLCRFD